MKKNNKLTISLIGISTISLISINRAYALEIKNPLVTVIEQLQEQTGSVNKYISSTISRKLDNLSESLEGDLQAVVQEAAGVLGLPDASKVRQEIEEIASDSNNAVNSVDRASNELDRQITRASGFTLTKEGQENMKAEVEKTQTSIETVSIFSDAAQNDVVTQNVMKRIAQQNTQISGILGEMRSDGLKSKQSQDLANLNLTNISRSVDGQNQARQKEVVGQGFSNLRTASQARLF
ncbi:hypothetical protein Riv7116_1729 [Rivularia sp. PCC 7116]|uniref:hypothetical protein n=1 Tax=Rivularia sp. PCC 7116 TaxID=373994 RepID=UPI00029F26B0|nr:hypothetical protein [Rivularia sp. PCC 7116]AFY54274.1 hypothetical protein Riv7116_1729 [Rivularia sp. PCC 7116]